MHGCDCSGKKSLSMKKWMVQGNPPKKVSMVKKINGRSLLLSSNKMARYFKNWTYPGGVLKKYMLLLQKFNASNRLS